MVSSPDSEFAETFIWLNARLIDHHCLSFSFQRADGGWYVN
jgi:hypothetical protein